MADTPKKEVKRSNAYPSITISEAIVLSEFVHKNSGNTYVKGEDIAGLMGKSLGAISQKIGSTVQYGLLEMKPGVGYRPTEIFKKIYKPIEAKERTDAIIEAFKSPKLYEMLIARFNNSTLPSETILANILERDYSIYDDAAKKAAQVFFVNINELELKNEFNELQLEKKAVIETIENEVGNDQESLNNVIKTEQIKKKEEEPSELLKIEIPLTSGKKAIIYYPNDILTNDIELLKLQISVLEQFVKFKEI